MAHILMAVLRIAFQSSPGAVGIQEEITVWSFRRAYLFLPHLIGIYVLEPQCRGRRRLFGLSKRVFLEPIQLYSHMYGGV
jgi:hypothetical protein